MSEIEQIDFSTLIWVKKELDETLSRAQSAIEAYVENPEDENQLQFCATYLHQVQGTLKMVELYGAAMVAEEMEQVATKILDKEVDSEKDAFEVLTRGILLLPDYLERIQLGHKDIPMVLLPLVNDLRTVKGDQLLSESALFNPNLSLGIPESNYNASFVLSDNQLTQVVNKIRSVYQFSLLNWLKGKDVDANLKKIQTIIDKLKTVVLEKDEKQMFWVAGGLFEALINGSLERSVTVKQLAARLDQAIRMIVSPDKDSTERPYKKITKNLLYYVALAQSKDRRIKEIQTFFNLSDFISDETEIENAKTSLSGKNKELLESVTTVIKEDLMSVQENLDLFNRKENADTSDMKNILESLNKISDTLGIIGVGVARSRIKNVVEDVEKEIKESEKVSKDSLMRIAETVLFVNLALDENILSLGEIGTDDTDSESNIASSEIRKIKDILAQESINSLQKVKQNFIQYIESSWNQEHLESSPKLLKQISGALKMSGFHEISEEIKKIEDYTVNHMLKKDYVPNVEKLDVLAEAIASLEYYLEYLSEGTKGEQSILELAQSNINKLFEPDDGLDNVEVESKESSSNLEQQIDEIAQLDEQFEELNEIDEQLENTMLDESIELVSDLDGSLDDLNENKDLSEIDKGNIEIQDFDSSELEFLDETETNSEEKLNSELDEINEMEFDESFKNDITNEQENSDKVTRLIVAFSEDTDEDIKEVFLEEFEEEVEHLNEIYPKWKNNPNEQFELLGEIRRIYHTLKGSGRLVGAMAIGDFSWKIEDMTNQVLNKTQDVSSSYLMVMDASKKILPELFEALKQESEVPAGYYAILSAAESVMAGNTISEIVINKVTKPTELVDDKNESQADVTISDKDATGTSEDEGLLEESSMEEFNLDRQIDSESQNVDLLDFEDDLLELDDDLSDESDLSVDPVFVEILQQEVEGHLNDIDEYLENAKSSGNYAPTEKFIRIVHTLNGAANMASVNSIVSMTTPLEIFAKSVLDNEKEFDQESIQQIETFKAESEKIMRDLSHLSNPTERTNGIGSFFKNANAEIIQGLSDADEDLSDFDLKQFIDESDTEFETSNVELDELAIGEELDHNDLMGEFDDLESEIKTIESNVEQSQSNDSETIEDELTLELDDLGLNEKNDLEQSSDLSQELTLEIDELGNEEDKQSELHKEEDADLTEDITLEIEDLELQDDSLDLSDELTLEVDELGDEEDKQSEFHKEEDADLTEDITLKIEDLELQDDSLDLSDELTLEVDELGDEEDKQSELHKEEDADLTEDITLEIEDLELQDDSSGLSEEHESDANLILEGEKSVPDDNSGVSDEISEGEEKLSEVTGKDDEVEDDSQELSEESKVEVEQTLEDKTIDEEAHEDIVEITGQDHISASVPTSYNDQTDSSEQESSDEFDEELLEIFQEEADDILDRTEHVLSDLEEEPNNLSLIEALQRDLHTLKGGARMAGLSNIGELSHVLESLLEKIGDDKREVDNRTFGIIHDSFDTLNKLKNENDFGQKSNINESIQKVKSLLELKDDVIPEKSKLDIGEFDSVDPMQESTETDVEVEETAAVATKKSNVLSGNQIKVNSELLDNLVNYAGEVSIYRSRLEQEVGSFRVNLSELGNTVARIREQLRKLDAETEAQIISTFQIEESGEDFDPLEMDRFSQLQQLSRSLTESVSDLTSIHSYLDDVARKSDNLLTQQSRVNAELQDGLMETRLVSFNSIVPRLRRLVRTTSKELKKPVKLEVHGAEGEMDKTVLEGVIAPLEHMIRNALAHGIESNRKKAKKSDTGHISLDLRREATEVVITVVDDGAGINREKVRQIAIEKGIIDKNKKISENDIDRLILHSGFSTVDKVSKIAGRGVGMDVVVNQINLLGGSLDISSEEGKGTKFIIRLPYTLALSNALLVEVAEQVYAVPISGLEGVIRMSYSDYLQRLKDGNMVYNYANEEYQIYELNKLLDIDSEVVVENNQIPLVMIRSGEDGVALRVDNVLGSREIVVKNVGAQISSVPGIYGATILGDGNVILILDVIPLSRSYVKKLKVIEESGYVAEEVEVTRDPIVMIVDDSITMRKVGERILRRNDYDVVTAKDGIDALDQLKEVVPDVMLLDIEMPRMDGYELAIEMKKIEAYANVPIIMITSRTGEKHRQKAMDLGVNRYLGKPYQEADLLENISELIEEFKN